MAETLRVQNPYFKGLIINFNDKTQALFRDKLEYEPNIEDQYHIVRKFDDLVSLSYKFYGESKLWFVIADVNNIFNPWELEVGKTIIIPSKSQIETQLL